MAGGLFPAEAWLVVEDPQVAHVGNVLHVPLWRVAFDGPAVLAHGFVLDLLKCVPADAFAVFARVSVDLDAGDGEPFHAAVAVDVEHGLVVAASPCAQWFRVRARIVGVVAEFLEPVHVLFDHVPAVHVAVHVLDVSAHGYLLFSRSSAVLWPSSVSAQLS